MNEPRGPVPRVVTRIALTLVLCCLVGASWPGLPSAWGQQDGVPAEPVAPAPSETTSSEPAAPVPAVAGDSAIEVAVDSAVAVDPVAMAEEALAEEDTSADVDGAGSESAGSGEPTRINLLDLLRKGGYLMAPIGLMSLIVVTFGGERFLGLRRRRVTPPALIRQLGELADRKGGLDPREAYRLCQRYPSTAAKVIGTMLLRLGRPHAEVEHAVAEASQREAGRLFANVRWLVLAATVTPLLGLLGTVWGMIDAFFHTANLAIGANKSQVLAEGIYVALVTTFAGLAVAIPAAVLAHYFEGRIQKLFRELDETVLDILPQLERFEGRLRVSHSQLDLPQAEVAAADPTAESAAESAVRPK